MIRALSLALSLAVPVAAYAQEAPAVHPVVIPNSDSWTMQSAEGRTYRIFVATPILPPPPEGYPVIYVLDAQHMFATATETVRALERRPDGGGPAIVVGIGYPDGVHPGQERKFDLTPRLGSPEPKQPGTGGAEAFMTFIETRLKPEIDRRYRINTKQEAVFGHSLAGLFTLYMLVNKPDLFDNWIAASPSIWFEEELIKRGNVRKRLAPKLATTGATPRVLITVGEFEQSIDPVFEPNKEKLNDRKQVDNAREFSEFLTQPGVLVKFENIAGEDHGTVIPTAISRGVRWALAGVQPPAAAPKPTPWVNKTGVPIPDIDTYVKMTPEARYKLRMRSRKIPSPAHAEWVAEFDRVLGSGLTYAQHRKLAEERVEMDKKHGTAPRED